MGYAGIVGVVCRLVCIHIEAIAEFRNDPTPAYTPHLSGPVTATNLVGDEIAPVAAWYTPSSRGPVESAKRPEPLGKDEHPAPGRRGQEEGRGARGA